MRPIAPKEALIYSECSNSSPFKGEAGWGMGHSRAYQQPIPTPALPLKGREK
jgi:hypothetical protein